VIKRRLSSDGIATVYQTRIPINAVDRVVKVYNVLVVPVDQREALAYHVLGELQKASRVRHPGIVEVHEIGMWNTFPYVETAFIEGADLDELLIRSGPLPANVACAVAVLICEALRFAHTSSVRHRGRNYAGVIHGDLKPTNVMISSDGRLRLLNFGTFGVFHEEAHIAGGGPDGSLRYCGFERLISGPVDGRTDLFSVGTVLYEMLTGQKAYEGKDVAAVMRARKTNTFRPITQAAPEVPGDLAEVVEQCMKRDPDDRPADVAEVLEFLTYAFGNLSEEHPATVVEEWFRSAYRPRRRPFERAVRQCAINPGFSNRSL
jgi:serine/threonine-protein kinase